MQQQTPNKPRITVIEVSISPPYKSMTVQGGTAHPVYSHRNKNTFSFDVTQLTFCSCDIFDEEDEDEDEEPDWIPIIESSHGINCFGEDRHHLLFHDIK